MCVPGHVGVICACAPAAFLVHHATCLRNIVVSFVASVAPQLSSTLSHKRHDFRENVAEHKMCVLIFYTTLSQTFLILRRIKQYTVINVKTPLRNAPVIFVGF